LRLYQYEGEQGKENAVPPPTPPHEIIEERKVGEGKFSSPPESAIPYEKKNP